MGDVQKKNLELQYVKTKKKIFLGAHNHIPYLRPFSKYLPIRVIVFVLLMVTLIQVVVFFTSYRLKPCELQTDLELDEPLMAKCSPEYINIVEKFEGCVPRVCKRIMTDKVISTEEADTLLHMARKFLEIGGPMDGVSKFNFHSGFLAKERYYVNMYGNTKMRDILSKNDFDTFRMVKEKIIYTIARQFGIKSSAIYMTHPTFFSDSRPRRHAFNVGEFLLSFDNEFNRTLTYSTVLYLGDYGIDFTGGRLIFHDRDNKYIRSVEPKKGRLVIYTSGDENVHKIEDVTWGSKYALHISFTCDKYFSIPDPDKIEMATLTHKDNKTVIRILTSAEVEKLIADFEKSEADAEAAKNKQPKP